MPPDQVPGPPELRLTRPDRGRRANFSGPFGPLKSGRSGCLFSGTASFRRSAFGTVSGDAPS